MTFTIGEMVGPYRLTEQLGQGGMATVYKAYHAALDRFVAIKVLHPAFTEDPNFLARFQREAKVVARLDHVNIVPIYDYAEHEGRPYLVMKFIEGETLKARLGRGPFSSGEVSRVVEAVGAALGYAHKRNILHRDVKPSNVLLAWDGQIYLADFGLARIAQAGESTLTSDMIVGTPQYISPEQAMGKKELDDGTDIYSFGVMLYELIVGKVPFSADTPFSVIHDHIYSPLPLPRQVNASVHPEVERFLLKALAKERGDRYKNVHELVAAFQQAWTDGAPTEAATVRVTPPAEAATIPPTPAAPPPPTTAQAQAPASTPIQGPTAQPAPVPAVGQTPPPLAATVPGPGKKRRVPWVWMAVAVIVALCCIFTFLAFRGNRLQRLQGTRVVPPEEFPAVVTPAVFEALVLAEERVNQNPDDPYAYIQLVAAYLDAEMPEDARDEMDGALEVGAQDEQFLWDACRQMETRQAWLLAARACFRAAELRQQTSLELPIDQLTLFHEVMYRAAGDPALTDYFSMQTMAPIDEPLAYITKARYLLYFGDPAEAQANLDSLVQIKPDMPEGLLLRAEFAARAGNRQEAQRWIDELLASPGVQEWMRQEAESILNP